MTKILMLLLACGLFTATAAQPKCELKSCKIVYEFFDGINTGYKTIIFTDSGLIDKQTVISKIDTSKLPPEAKSMFTVLNETKQLKIQTKDTIYLIDLISMSGIKSTRWGVGLSVGDPFITKVGTDTFMNRVCEVYDAKVSKIWYWKGVCLKKELTFKEGGKVYERAILIDENYIVKEDEFTVPSGVKFDN